MGCDVILRFIQCKAFCWKWFIISMRESFRKTFVITYNYISLFWYSFFFYCFNFATLTLKFIFEFILFLQGFRVSFPPLLWSATLIVLKAFWLFQLFHNTTIYLMGNQFLPSLRWAWYIIMFGYWFLCELTSLPFIYCSPVQSSYNTQCQRSFNSTSTFKGTAHFPVTKFNFPYASVHATLRLKSI